MAAWEPQPGRALPWAAEAFGPPEAHGGRHWHLMAKHLHLRTKPHNSPAIHRKGNFLHIPNRAAQFRAALTRKGNVMYDTEELAERIREELDLTSRRLARLVWLLHDMESWFDNGDVDLGGRQPEIELALELSQELAYAARRDLAELELACARALGEDDMDMAA